MPSERRTLLTKLCPVCGREADVLYGGMCEECYRKLHPLAELPEVLEVTLCRACGAYKLGGRWMRPRGGDALREALEAAVKRSLRVRGYVENVAITEIEGGRVRVLVSGYAAEGMRSYEEEYVAVVRVRWGLCRECVLAKSKREVARVQVRARGRGLTSAEIALAKRVVERFLSSRWRGNLDLIDVVEEGDTLDFVFSSIPSARLAADALKRELPSTVLETRKSAGVDDSGKRFAKITFRILLPEFKAGDLIEFRGKLYYVTRMSGEGVWAIDLDRLEEVKLGRSKELIENGRIVRRGEELEPVIVASVRGDEVEVVTLKGGKSISLHLERLHPQLKEGGSALLAVIGTKYYVLPPARPPV
jgi:nonsense-mediated mRNA decay protein 3